MHTARSSHLSILHWRSRLVCAKRLMPSTHYLSILHWRCPSDEHFNGLRTYQIAFNTPLEMPPTAPLLAVFARPLSILHWRCTALLHAARRLGAELPFNTPSEMQGQGVVEVATVFPYQLSILHWRCAHDRQRRGSARRLHFQYSIGDARKMRLPQRLRDVEGLSILHWRCPRASPRRRLRRFSLSILHWRCASRARRRQ